MSVLSSKTKTHKNELGMTKVPLTVRLSTGRGTDIPTELHCAPLLCLSFVNAQGHLMDHLTGTQLKLQGSHFKWLQGSNQSRKLSGSQGTGRTRTLSSAVGPDKF